MERAEKESDFHIVRQASFNVVSISFIIYLYIGVMFKSVILWMVFKRLKKK